jgi:hypothetical protein
VGLVSGISELFDSYSRQARLFPALLTVFAPLIALLAWFPTLLLSNIGGALLTIGSSCGLLYLLASLARTSGKKVEKRLLIEWGAWPTTYLLRHSSRLDKHTRARYHGFLAGRVPGISFPSQVVEEQDTDGADAVYDSAVKWLKERARGKEFPLVEKENAQYGFRRNLRGMKALGSSLCVITLLLFVLAVVLREPQLVSQFRSNPGGVAGHLALELPPAIWAAVALNVIALFCWIFIVTDNWVKTGGEQYAEALLATCDRISATTATTAEAGRSSRKHSGTEG